jgi:hypothetical protein
MSEMAGRNLGSALFGGIKALGEMTLSTAIAMGEVYNFLKELAGREERIDVGAIQASLDALRAMTYVLQTGSIQDLIERRQRRAADALDEFTESLQDATYNLPSWYRYQQTLHESSNVTSRSSLDRGGMPGSRDWTGRG